MKTLKLLGVSLLLLGIVSCGNDDDGGDMGKTNQELLIAGIWYQEDASDEDLTDCEKNSSFNFVNNTDLEIEAFDTITGTNCESIGAFNATYSLTNDVDITITLIGETINGKIESLNDNELIISNDGETITFDRTPG